MRTLIALLRSIGALQGVTPHERLVLYAMLDDMRWDAGIVATTVTHLSARSGLCRRTVGFILEALARPERRIMRRTVGPNRSSFIELILGPNGADNGCAPGAQPEAAPVAQPDPDGLRTGCASDAKPMRIRCEADAHLMRSPCASDPPPEPSCEAGAHQMRSPCASDAKPVRNLAPLLNSKDKNSSSSSSSNSDQEANRAKECVAAAAAAVRDELPEDVIAVIASLRSLGIGDELLAHPNATPARLAWIARTAASRSSPGGWAAAAIRDAYAVPAVQAFSATNGAIVPPHVSARAAMETRRMLDAKKPEAGAMTMRDARAQGLIREPGRREQAHA